MECVGILYVMGGILCDLSGCPYRYQYRYIDRSCEQVIYWCLLVSKRLETVFDNDSSFVRARRRRMESNKIYLTTLTRSLVVIFKDVRRIQLDPV